MVSHSSPEQHALDRRFMAAAIRLSRRNLGRTATNPSVAGDRISYRVELSQIGGQGAVNVTAIRYSTLLIGSLVVPDGSVHTFKGVRVGDAGAIPKFEEIDRGQCFAAALVHEGKDKTEQWLLVRLNQPDNSTQPSDQSTQQSE